MKKSVLAYAAVGAGLACLAAYLLLLVTFLIGRANSSGWSSDPVSYVLTPEGIVILFSWFIVPAGAASGAVVGALIPNTRMPSALLVSLGALSTFTVLLVAGAALALAGVHLNVAFIGTYAAAITAAFVYWRVYRRGRDSV